MEFRTFFLNMSRVEREAYAAATGSTVGYLLQVAYGNKRVELGAADVMVAVATGALALEDLPLTARAAQQHAIRSRAAVTEPLSQEARDAA